ncbi:MAG TPA: tetratricopeptide repeat protein [Silvibacterium sp.]|nr:tetratricopeptide repeat protein [Silvibacterium sp.]
MSSKPYLRTIARTGATYLASIATLALASAVTSAAQPQAQTVKPATQPAAPASSSQPDRAGAYYHYMLAHEYEDMANTYGRPEYATRAIEEYKLALDADPTSKFLTSGLAELYFRTGRVRDAVIAAQDQIKKDPNNLDAHKLLGNIYLRSLGDNQQSGPTEEMLKLAIAEYVKIVSLEPQSIQDHLLLGQLYSFAHDSVHAEEQFSTAEKIDPGSEETALNLARLYTEQGDPNRAIKVLNNLPEDDKTGKTEFVLGASYDRLKDTQHAIEAYKKALELEPDNLDTERALAKVLLNDNQLTPALQAYQDIASGDPTDPDAYLHISEIQRRQGNYEEALTTLKKAKSLVSDSLEINFNEGLIDDALGRYDDAVQIFEKLVADSEHATGQYSESEKSNRSLFLERLAILYREQNKIDQAIATYQKMADLGGEFASHAYESEVDTYRDVHQYNKATQIAREAVEKLQKQREQRGMKLMLANQLADTGHADEGIAMARSMLNKTPADLEVYRQLANIYTRLRRWKDASDAIDQAEQLSTKTDDKFYIAFLRGTLFERQKLYDQAEAEFRKALTLDPTNSTTLNYLGYMLADHGMKLEEALSMIKKAVELDPQNYAYLDSLGWAYFKLGQYNLAENQLRKAVERNSMDGTVHDHLGELYEKTGRLKLAASQWEESLNEYGQTIAADMDPGDLGKVQRKLDSVRVRLAREGPVVQPAKP